MSPPCGSDRGLAGLCETFLFSVNKCCVILCWGVRKKQRRIMGRDGFKFDLETQRFLINRWETKIGQRVRDKIISGIKNSVELRAILDDYVLDHPENMEPYGYPVYPKSEMGKDKFWVLTQDDLRGIHIYNEDFSSSQCLEKKALSYSSFYNCNLSNTNIERADISYACFEKCNMEGVILAVSGGFSTRINDCVLTNACFFQSGFRDCNFNGSDFTGVYFEGALLENIKVNHRTKFDVKLAGIWKTRSMPPEQKPDILRAIRIAYEKAELWNHMDSFLFEEKVVQRKHLLWAIFKQEKSLASFTRWLGNYISCIISGYSTKPFRVILMSVIVTIVFSMLYLFFGTPSHNNISVAAILESLYFSLTTFATLGYGDLSYDASRPYMRILSTSEAWIGAVSIALFVVILARKVFR